MMIARSVTIRVAIRVPIILKIMRGKAILGFLRGLGFEVWGFRVWGSGFRAYGLGFLREEDQRPFFL